MELLTPTDEAHVPAARNEITGITKPEDMAWFDNVPASWSSCRSVGACAVVASA